MLAGKHSTPSRAPPASPRPVARSSATSASRRVRRSSRAGSGGGGGCRARDRRGASRSSTTGPGATTTAAVLGHLAAEQVRVARLLLPRPALEAHDEIAVGEPLDRGVELLRLGEVVQPVGALAQLARSLRAAEQEHGEDGLLVRADAERLVEQVAVLRRAAAVVAGQPRPAPVTEPREGVAEDVLVVLDDRVAVRRLVARRPQRVERERVGVGRHALLLQQAAEDADLGVGEVVAHRGRDGCTAAMRKTPPMTQKADFNAEEWTTLANAPALVGMLVIAASNGRDRP